MRGGAEETLQLPIDREAFARGDEDPRCSSSAVGARRVFLMPPMPSTPRTGLRAISSFFSIALKKHARTVR